MKLKRLIVCTMALALTLTMFAGSVTVFAADKASAKFTIVHTNDVHSRVQVEPYAAELVKQKRAADENVILLSAGDVLHGQPIATLSRGKSIVEIMNAAGYEAIAPGNHDFNYGYRRLAAFEKNMDFPVLAANVTKKLNGKEAFKPYIIKNFDGVKVGIFGLATPETMTKTNPNNVSELEIENPYIVAQRMVKTLKAEGCNVIVALAHLGMDEETWYYNRSTAVATVEGIDIIIDGHSHTELSKGKVVGNALIAQAGYYGENIGMVDVEVINGKVTAKSATLLKTPTEENPIEGLPPEQNVTALITKLNKANEALTSQVVGKIPFDLDGERERVRKQQTNLGDLITDAMIQETGAQIALTNGGGIRASIKAGDVTKGDILTVLPFGNYVVVKKVTGANVIAALEHSVSEYPVLAGSFLHVSGIKFTFDPGKEAGSRVVSVTLRDGTQIDPLKTYSVATNDFLADGGDGYEMLKSNVSVDYSALDEVLIKYMQSHSDKISATASNRVTAVNTSK